MAQTPPPPHFQAQELSFPSYPGRDQSDLDGAITLAQLLGNTSPQLEGDDDLPFADTTHFVNITSWDPPTLSKATPQGSMPDPLLSDEFSALEDTLSSWSPALDTPASNKDFLQTCLEMTVNSVQSMLTRIEKLEATTLELKASNDQLLLRLEEIEKSNETNSVFCQRLEKHQGESSQVLFDVLTLLKKKKHTDGNKLPQFEYHILTNMMDPPVASPSMVFIDQLAIEAFDSRLYWVDDFHSRFEEQD
ncbi:unnamed protein product [Clonostachys chloroleuca]|uniref:Uncharacterized protein n=1 Tax=Clonostachys chloroleuca TaxID=1926264 RepID=A0AA35LSB9_9HYPO|nr:unnamed protein product [Clonostachys chloroleuca]